MRIFFLLFSVIVFSQSTLKPVEFITENNEKLSGFINSQKIYEEEYFEFTSDLNQPTKQIAINTIKEFVIDSTEIYLVRDVLIDKNRTNDIQSNGDFEVKMIKKRITLRKIVEGEYNLYISYFNQAQCFFYSKKNDANITYLVYNQINSDGYIKSNLLFVNQLKIVFNDININDRLKYSKTDLANLFIKKNGGNSVDLTKSDYKGKIQYKIFGGIKNHNVTFESEFFKGKKLSDSKSSPTFGAELMYNYSKKFDVFTRISYDNAIDIRVNDYAPISASSTMIYEDFIYEASYLNFNFGLRHYLSDRKNRIFIDLSLEYSKIMNSKLLVVIATDNPNPDSNDYESLISNDGISLNTGIGYEFNQKYGLELRYSTGKEFYNKNTNVDSKASNLNLNVYYKFN